MYWVLPFLWQLKVWVGKCILHRKGAYLSACGMFIRWAAGMCALLGDWCKLWWNPLAPLPVIWKRSPIKNWPLLWHIHNTMRQRQGTIGIFSKLGKQSYREKNKAILSLYQNMQNTVFFVTLLFLLLCLICQVQSLIAMFPKFELVTYQLHDLCHA